MMSKKNIRALLIILLIIAGIVIKAYYINYTETWERQHDVIAFGADEGHAAYIEYILNNKHLPDFDPREKWAFFQPPLHHTVSAFVISLSKTFGADEHRAQENTQVATCLYMILTLLMSIYIFLKSKGVSKISLKNVTEDIYTEGMLAMLAIVAVHPMFTLLSGSINNDALALVLSVVALIVAAKWDDNPNYFRTILLALVIGLAMLSKLTGGLVAVPIGILMVRKFFGYSDKNGDKVVGSDLSLKDRFVTFFENYFIKAAIFGIIVFPLGLGFEIRNKIKWDMPLNYIPPVGEVFAKDITIKNRLFDLLTDNVYAKMIQRGDAFDEYNVPLALVKTSLFGEYSYAEVSRWMKPLSIIVFVSALILIVVGIIATVSVMISRDSKVPLRWKVILSGTYFTYLVAYLYFALSSDNFSAQDFRYAAICIICEGIFIGLYVDNSKNKKLSCVVIITALIFAASSFLTYALLGFKS